MKKKYIFLLIIISLFTMIGCGESSNNSNNDNNTNNINDNNDKNNVEKEVTINNIKYKFIDNGKFHDLSFKYEKYAENFALNDNDDNHKVLVFYQGKTNNDLFRITLSYYKDKEIKEILDRYKLDTNAKTKNYNNINWYNYREETENYIIQYYFYQNKNDSYIAAFSVEKKLKISIDEYINEFMNNVKF